MAQFMGSRNLNKRDKVATTLDMEHWPQNKRHKPSSPSQQQWNASKSNEVLPSNSLSQYNNILDEPGPLGLLLRKSPSLLELIQMKLSQVTMSTTANTANTNIENLNTGLKKASQDSATTSSGPIVKLKATNFPATLLRIGSWEYQSRYEGDLVAKCYFARSRLIWEVVNGELKNKIEIQWSDIMALKADCPDNGPSSLTLVLAKQPLFFREVEPEPKKRTQWLATSDFTDGQASKHRLHFLQCPQGLLTEHFEKLIQCDTRLYFLSRQPEIILDSPHFDGQSSAYKNLGNVKNHGVHRVNGEGSATSCFQDIGSPHSSLSPSFSIEQNGPPNITLDSLSCEALSPSSGMEWLATEGNSSSVTDSNGPRNLDQITLPGLRRSMSVSDFIGHVELCLSEEMTSGNPSFSGRRSEYQDILDGIAHDLLSDNQATEASSDENSLMSRVNSLCCLLQMDPVAVQNPHDKASSVEGPEDGENLPGSHDHEPMQDYQIEIDVEGEAADDEDLRDFSGGKQAAPGMSRKDSFAEFLFHLPRIVSLPKLDILEEGNDVKATDEDLRDVSGGEQAPGMSRKDSFMDLLMLYDIPRIASLPKFLSEIS